MSAGTREDIRWFRQQLDTRSDVKSLVEGVGPEEAMEERLVRHTIRVTVLGWEFEADQNHAELIIQDLQLDGASSVKTLGDDERP